MTQVAEVNDPWALREYCFAHVVQQNDEGMRCDLPTVWITRSQLQLQQQAQKRGRGLEHDVAAGGGEAQNGNWPRQHRPRSRADRVPGEAVLSNYLRTRNRHELDGPDRPERRPGARDGRRRDRPGPARGRQRRQRNDNSTAAKVRQPAPRAGDEPDKGQCLCSNAARASSGTNRRAGDRDGTAAGARRQRARTYQELKPGIATPDRNSRAVHRGAGQFPRFLPSAGFSCPQTLVAVRCMAWAWQGTVSLR